MVAERGTRQTDDRVSDDEAARIATTTRGDRVVQVSVAILATLALLVALRAADFFLMPTVLAALIALAVTPFAAMLEKVGVPRFPAAFIVTFGLLASIMSVGYVLLPSIDEWRYRAPETAIMIERKLRALDAQVEEATSTAERMAPDLTDPESSSTGRGEGGEATDGAEGAGTDADTPPEGEREEKAPDVKPTEQIVEGGRRFATDLLTSAPEIAGAAIYGIFLIFFLTAERRRVLRFVMGLANSRRQAAQIGRLMGEIRRTVGLYLATVSIINICLGIATAGVFYLLDVPSPLLWGALMMVMNFMPYVGPLVVQVAVFAVGFVTFPTLTQALWPPLALLALNMIEGQLVTPYALGLRVRLSPLAVFVAVAFGAWLWGMVGAIVATPMLIAGIGIGRLWAEERRRTERITLRLSQERLERERAAEKTGSEPLAAE